LPKLGQLTATAQWLTPIFDRNAEDALRVKYFLSLGYKNMTSSEKETWLNSDLKGALNASDLSRIESNMSIISEILKIQIETKTWSELDIPNTSDFSRIRSNLILIKNNALVHDTTPNVPDLPFNNYQKINDIEKILFDIHEILTSQTYYYCGLELYCGENMGLT
jgi:hypothetical protein